MYRFSYLKNHCDISFTDTNFFIFINFHTNSKIFIVSEYLPFSQILSTSTLWKILEFEFWQLSFSMIYLFAQCTVHCSEPSHCTHVNKIFNIESKVQYLCSKNKAYHFQSNQSNL